MDSVLQDIFVKLPTMVKGKTLILKGVIDYFKEPEEKTEIMDESEQVTRASFRQPLQSELLVKTSNSLHKSKTYESVDELIGDRYSAPMTKLHGVARKESSFLQEEIISLLTYSKALENTYSWFSGLFEEETHFIEYSFVRFDLLEKSELIHLLL